MSTSPYQFRVHQVLLKSSRGVGGDLAHLLASPNGLDTRPAVCREALSGSRRAEAQARTRRSGTPRPLDRFRLLGAVSCQFEVKLRLPALD
jgi:hypothetical protein